MKEDQKLFEITDQETGEVYSINPQSLISDIRDILLDRRRNQIEAVTWKKLPEIQQNDEINAMQNLAFDIISKVVEIVAQGNHPVIHSILETFTVKDGEVKIVSKGRADDQCLLSLNHVGKKSLKMIVADTEQFDRQGRDLEAQPDQPDMFEDKDEKPQDDAKGMLDKVVGDHSNESPFDDSDEIDEPPADEPEPEPVPEPKEFDPEEYEAMGVEQAKLGKPASGGVYSIGSPEYKAWMAGHANLMDEVESLRTQGFDARNDGMGPGRSGFKKGTWEQKAWKTGYDEAKEKEE